MLICYHGIAKGLFFPYIYQESTNIPCMTSQSRHNCRFCPICPKYRSKSNFCQKVLNIKISPECLLIKEGNDVSNIYCKIQDHTKKIFLKILIFIIARLHQLSYDFDGLPYPG